MRLTEHEKIKILHERIADKTLLFLTASRCVCEVRDGRAEGSYKEMLLEFIKSINEINSVANAAKKELKNL